MTRAAHHLQEEDVQVITTQGSTAGELGDAGPVENGQHPDGGPVDFGMPPDGLVHHGAPPPSDNGAGKNILSLLGHHETATGLAPGLLPTPGTMDPRGPQGDSDRWDIPGERPIDDPCFLHDAPGFALHAACTESNTHHVRDLLGQGYAVNMPAKSKQTPIHHAAWRGNLAVVQLLVDHQADVNAVDEGGWTPLHKTVTGCNHFTDDHVGVLEILLSSGAKINDVGGAHGQTAMHLAAREGLVQLVDKLVQRGAGNRPDVNGRTPMEYALRRRRDDGGVSSLEMVELLRVYFANQEHWNGEQIAPQQPHRAGDSPAGHHVPIITKWRCYEGLRKALEHMRVWSRATDEVAQEVARLMPQIDNLVGLMGAVVPAEFRDAQNNSDDPYSSVSVCNGAWLDDDFKPFSEKRFPFRPPHMSVLVDETLEGLGAHLGGTFIDGTFGAGGHTQALLKANPQNYVLATDVDPGVQCFVDKVVAKYPDRFTFAATNFSNLGNVAREHGVAGAVQGVLMDLGQSFMQIDTPSRGHSHQLPGPLDMRFDTTRMPTGADFLNNASFEELCFCLESTQSAFTPVRIRRIANIIMDGRTREPLQTVGQLRGLLASHFLSDGDIKLAFQSVRMHINREIDEIATGATEAWSVLAPGGRLCIIVFKPPEREAVERALQEPPLKGNAKVHRFCPTHDEYIRNSRCHSAELFVITKLN